MRINSRIQILLVFSLLWVSLTLEAGPKIQHWTHAQGAQVYFVQADGLPMLDLRVLWDAGSARDGEQYGVAALTSALLDSGAGDWNADAIAARLEGVGAEMGTGASRDSAWISLRTLTEPRLMNTALETVNRVISQPRFKQSDFDRDKRRTLAGLRQQEESPAAIASIAFYNKLYGPHPYAHPESGTLQSVERLRREDLVRFHKQHYTSRHAIVVLVGDISRKQAESITQQVLQGLPEGESLPKLTDVPVSGQGLTVRKNFPSQQTHIYSGMPVVRRGDPDHVPLYVGNHILGGSGLVSKISEEVREKRGLAYSAYSHFAPMKAAGPFTMGLQTRNDQATQALSVLQQTLADFVKNGPTPGELEAARKNITGGYVLRYDSNSKLTEYIAMIAYYGLSLDYLDSFPAAVANVTAEQIRNAFQHRVKPEQFVTVLVGGGAGSDAQPAP